MKYQILHNYPRAPFIEALKGSPSLQAEIASKALIPEDAEKFINNRADIIAVAGKPLDDVHDFYFSMFKDKLNGVNIEAEIILIDKEKDIYQYGIEIVFTDKPIVEPALDPDGNKIEEPNGDVRMVPVRVVRPGSNRKVNLMLSMQVEDILKENKVEYVQAV